MTTTTAPGKHRRIAPDLPALRELDLIEADHGIAARRSGPSQHVHTVHHRTTDDDGQVIVVMSPAAAEVLGLVLSRTANRYRGPQDGLKDFDPALWQDVAIDLIRHKALAGHVPEPVHARAMPGTKLGGDR